MKYIHPKRFVRLLKERISVMVPFYLIPDKCYLSWKFKQTFGRSIDWNNPKSFNEKLNWLKLYDRKPNYHLFIDKFRVKDIVKTVIGEEYIIPTIAGPFKSVDEINRSELPERFVIKCNHDSASVMICKDKDNFNWDFARFKLSMCMRHDYYKLLNRQWAYKGIDRCIFVEKFMEDEETHSLPDYKFYCFNGKVKCINVGMGRFTLKGGVHVNLYDRDWKQIPCQHCHDNYDGVIERPAKLDKMIEIAEQLAQCVGNPFTRVDLYFINGKIYFGEITFYPEGGLGYIRPYEYDLLFGSWMDLSKCKK